MAKWKERETPEPRTRPSRSKKGHDGVKVRNCHTCIDKSASEKQKCPACKGQGGIDLRTI